MDFKLGLFGSHNSSIAISVNNQIKEVVELERWVGVKNAAFAFHFPIPDPEQKLRDILNYFKNKYQAEKYNLVAYTSDNNLHKLIKSDEYRYIPHHTAHCANGLYQSPYDKAIVVSFDGGSEEGFFKILKIGFRSIVSKKILGFSKHRFLIKTCPPSIDLFKFFRFLIFFLICFLFNFSSLSNSSFN